MSFGKSSASLLALLFLIFALPSIAQGDMDDDHKAKSLAVLNYVTGWTLDSAGYHPSVFMLLENTSGRDLSGVTIKMQGKFTDIHTLEPSTAKIEIRRSLKPHQQFPVALVAPKEFELPRDTNFWPVMECKAMMRVGSVGDEGTEYLLVTKVDSATSTQDDAFQKLNELTSYNRTNQSAGNNGRSDNRKPRGDAPSSTKPLIAKADKIKAPPAVTQKITDIFGVKPLPGLGDDFYNFEKSFGLPIGTDAKKKDFTWAKYRHQGSGTSLVVASKERSGKVDLITFVLPRSGTKNEQTLIDQCKLFAGTQKASKLGPVAKSVRYLPSGRLEMISSIGPGLKILALALPDAADRPPSYLIMITRLGAEPDELLRAHQAGNEVLIDLPLGESPPSEH